VAISATGSSETVRDVIEHLLTTATPGGDYAINTQRHAYSVRRVVALLDSPAASSDRSSFSYINKRLQVIAVIIVHVA